MVENFDVECSGEWLREVWRRTVMRNVLDDFDVECGGERWCEIWWRTFDAESSGER